MEALKFRTSFAGSIGNLLEWYDFAVFGYFAPFIGAQFFPTDDPMSALINTFGVFAAGYLARPIGGVLFGQIRDRLGRTRALQLSIFLMAVPTTLITFVPTHATVGVLAPVLLVILRLAQGISVGGEFIGSCCYLVEAAPSGRRGFFGSWSTFGTIGGMLLGSAVATLLQDVLSTEQLHAWGWRLPFLGGLLVGVVGWQMRRGTQETPEFVRLQDAGQIEQRPALEALREMPLRVLQVAGIVLLFGVGIYTLFVWMPTYLTHFVKPPVPHALLINTLCMVLLIATMPIAGLLADRLGYKSFLRSGRSRQAFWFIRSLGGSIPVQQWAQRFRSQSLLSSTATSRERCPSQWRNYFLPVCGTAPWRLATTSRSLSSVAQLRSSSLG